ncbi:MAG: lysozyme inhibitor LprI family protein [Pseudomonadota bacterium]
MKWVTIFMCFLALPAAAQELQFSPSNTEACLEAATSLAEREACIGASASLCMELTEGGYSTVGMSACSNMELMWWDDRLNAVYRALRSQKRREDSESAGFPGAPDQVQALLEMQRAWITFRDTTCWFERSLWGGGTGGGPAAVSCLMMQTGRQSLYLEEFLSGG